MKEFTIQCKVRTLEHYFTQSRCNDISGGSELHYIGRIKKGSARLVSESVTVELSEGDVFYIPRGIPYKSFWFADNEGVRFDSFGFSEFPSAPGQRFAFQKIPYNNLQNSLMDELALETSRSENSLKVAGLLMSLLSQVFSSLARAEKNDKQKLLVNRALSVMRDNTAMDIPAVAVACAVSESGLYSAFRTCGCDTPIHERQMILVRKAVNLLISGDDPVEMISAELGFSSSSYFRKIIKKYTGKTPREIRKSAFL